MIINGKHYTPEMLEVYKQALYDFEHFSDDYQSNETHLVIQTVIDLYWDHVWGFDSEVG